MPAVRRSPSIITDMRSADRRITDLESRRFLLAWQTDVFGAKAGSASTYKLSSKPVSGTLFVQVGNTLLTEETGYDFDSKLNLLVLSSSYTPGTRVTVRYLTIPQATVVIVGGTDDQGNDIPPGDGETPTGGGYGADGYGEGGYGE